MPPMNARGRASSMRVSLMLAPALALLALFGCGSSSKVPASGGVGPGAVAGAKGSAPNAVAAPRGRSTWLPAAQNGELDTIEGAPLISVDGEDVLLDGLRVGDVHAVLAKGRSARVDALFAALRSRREAWLATHAGEPWPGVVAYRFHPEVSAAVVKSVVLTAGYAACPNGSFLVEMTADGRKRVGRLPIDPLMVTEPEEKVLSVDVKKDAIVVTWKETKGASPTKVIPSLDVASLESEVDAMWSASGLHRSPSDKRFDQAVLHVDDVLPYKTLIAIVDALYAPRRSMQVGRHEERVPALNVNLAPE
jgi:hypothetical protein